MEFLLLVLPLLIIIFLLVRKQHMLVAAFIGGALAIILGRLDAVVINKLFTEGITKMLGMTVPILYAATASMVTKAGSINSVVNLANHYFKGRIAILAGFMVLIQGVATLMSGRPQHYDGRHRPRHRRLLGGLRDHRRLRSRAAASISGPLTANGKTCPLSVPADP